MAQHKDCPEYPPMYQGKATGWRYEEVARLLKRAHYTSYGEGGSHRTWVHDQTGKRVPLVDHGNGELLPVYVKRAGKAMWETGGCK